MYSPHQESMARYEKALAQAKVTEGMSVFNEVVAELVKGGKEAINAYSEKTDRLWEEASPWERIGLSGRYDVVEAAKSSLSAVTYEIFNKRENAFGGATVGAILVSVKDKESDG